MRALALSALIAFPLQVHATGMDDLMAAPCGIVFTVQTNATIIKADVLTAYAAYLTVWIIYARELGIDPPVEAVCTEDPTLTFEAALTEALSRVKK